MAGRNQFQCITISINLVTEWDIQIIYHKKNAKHCLISCFWLFNRINFVVLKLQYSWKKTKQRTFLFSMTPV